METKKTAEQYNFFETVVLQVQQLDGQTSRQGCGCNANIRVIITLNNSNYNANLRVIITLNNSYYNANIRVLKTLIIT